MTEFSYQLYSSRKFLPIGDTLAMLAANGYAGVEGYGGLMADAEQVSALKDALATTGLRMDTCHIGLDMITDQPEKVIEIARALGISRIYCPHIAADLRPDNAQGWTEFGARLQVAGQPLRDAGLGFGWHNHDFEFERTPEGTMPMDAILAGGPDLEWEADIAWIVRGGADPLDSIARHGHRITSVHVKDIAPQGEKADEDGWADVGDGIVDWAGLFVALRQIGVSHYVMEHDNPAEDSRFAERSIAACRRLSEGLPA